MTKEDITQSKPRPMSEAPRDGTKVLGFVVGCSTPVIMDYCNIDGWPSGWEGDDGSIAEKWLLGWLPCPTYTGEAVK